jgi:hypothetical protein
VAGEAAEATYSPKIDQNQSKDESGRKITNHCNVIISKKLLKYSQALMHYMVGLSVF